MSIRSGANSNLVLNDLTVNGTLTLAHELDINNLEVEGDTSLNTLEVSDLTTLNDLVVSGDALFDTVEVNGDTSLNTLEAGDTTLESLDVLGDTLLETLKVEGDTSLNTLTVNGITNLNGTTYGTALKVTNNLTVYGELDMYANIQANSAIITPQQLGYVSGATSNIQSQINGKANLSSPSFSGTVKLPTTQCSGYTYIGNDGTTLPTYNLSGYFGAIGSNMTNGNGEMDFINTGYSESNTTLSAFDWYMMTSSTAKTLLMRLYHSGELWISGLLNAVGGITTSTLTVTGHSQLTDVSSNNMTVTGNLNVTGQITSANPIGKEKLIYLLTGDQPSASATMTLTKNVNNNTNYVVTSSLFYNYSGSSGTYDIVGTSNNMGNIVYSAKTNSSFTWTVGKADGDNVNINIEFCVEYF